MRSEEKKPGGRRIVQPRKKALLSRLNRIEGQIKGVARMIDEDRNCVDVLTQISAARSALDAVAMQLLHDHTHGCVQNAICNGTGDQAITELMGIIGILKR